MNMIFDLHCDLPTKVYLNHASVTSNSCHWAIDKIPFSNFVQFFACYIDKEAVKHPFAYTCNMISSFKEAVNQSENLRLVKSYAAIEKNAQNNIHSGVLTIEGGEALEGNLKNLSYFYEQGVRLLTLTWNYENELGYGVLENKDSAPLKPFGLQVISKMEALGMLVDVSHLNEGGFWSVAEHTSKPFVASHSNARKICGHKRNLTDEQISCIIQRNGMIGLNLYPLFLNDNGNADITDILKHIEHFLVLGAENNLMLGCDFDGIDTTPNGLSDISKLYSLITEMEKNNFSSEIIAKIFQDNGKNLLKSQLS